MRNSILVFFFGSWHRTLLFQPAASLANVGIGFFKLFLTVFRFFVIFFSPVEPLVAEFGVSSSHTYPRRPAPILSQRVGRVRNSPEFSAVRHDFLPKSSPRRPIRKRFTYRYFVSVRCPYRIRDSRRCLRESCPPRDTTGNQVSAKTNRR